MGLGGSAVPWGGSLSFCFLISQTLWGLASSGGHFAAHRQGAQPRRREAFAVARSIYLVSAKTALNPGLQRQP